MATSRNRYGLNTYNISKYMAAKGGVTVCLGDNGGQVFLRHGKMFDLWHFGAISKCDTTHAGQRKISTRSAPIFPKKLPRTEQNFVCSRRLISIAVAAAQRHQVGQGNKQPRAKEPRTGKYIDTFVSASMWANLCAGDWSISQTICSSNACSHVRGLLVPPTE